MEGLEVFSFPQTVFITFSCAELENKDSITMFKTTIWDTTRWYTETDYEIKLTFFKIWSGFIGLQLLKIPEFKNLQNHLTQVPLSSNLPFPLIVSNKKKNNHWNRTSWILNLGCVSILLVSRLTNVAREKHTSTERSQVKQTHFRTKLKLFHDGSEGHKRFGKTAWLKEQKQSQKCSSEGPFTFLLLSSWKPNEKNL